jgi:hypothetical protein
MPPNTPEGKRSFLQLFSNIQMSDLVKWLIVEYFKLIRKPEGRNREGGNLQEMFLFNEAISTLGLLELPLLGRHFTWSNKQSTPF